MVEKIDVSARAAAIEYAIRDVVVPAVELEKEGHEIIRLNVGDPLAFEGLPTPSHMISAYKQALDRQDNGYGPSYGIPELRQAIADSESRKGWACTSDDVYVTHGVTEALQILFAAFLESGDKVLAPGPHYPPYMAYPQMYGAETIEYRLDPNDGWRIDFDDIESKMDDNVRLLVLINPNNPTGNVASKEEIDALIKLAQKWPRCTIIADEIYDGLDFTGGLVSAASCSEDVPVIVLNGVSKVYFAPGWRIGYMAWHDPNGILDLVRDGVERLLRSRLCASTPAQFGYLAGLLDESDWLQGHRERIKKRLDHCIMRISGIEGIECQEPGGAFYLFVRITRTDLSSDDKKFVLDLLHERHVLVVHGSGFSPEYGSGHFRMVCLPPIEILDEAFDRISDFLGR
ncbi:MAG: alanine aminotransferase [Euryarchaeota archaeon]|nr:alanine aminotransferase [Euryarchaeota archaeon]MBK38192.1 alanine aminotransferase [Euryarchaeota archaeon]MBT86016.1 alanine aminotransferase [Euryarchaeota archaeon]DAC47543.1 MAG TPA: aminotransferase class I/II-fold pyridoxal phosphate-dependent enzyme [Candidatus Poseidoniales archaeon]HII33586.1 aminotransferase class I/II-fold pyridoxal phosphate-dependent enzyme [Candidatus Thalassarchaeaceae archaeon]|tara:strand:+ start:3744 stop:4946 length:1203 start_codon:yes stop_codon:yes gene_type:complete